MEKESRKFVMPGIFLGVSAVYLAFPTRNYYWDGVGFALAIENSGSFGSGLEHPNHLLYNFFGYLIYSIVHPVLPEMRALHILQYANGFLSAIAAVVIYRISALLTGHWQTSLWVTALFSFAATWWKYSTDADAYIPSILFLLICFYLLVEDREARPFSIAGCHLVAIVFHQLAVLFFPVVIAGFLLKSQEKTCTKPFRQIAVYSAATIVGSVAAYAAAYYAINERLDIAGFWAWTTSHTSETGFIWNAFDSIKYSVRGNIHLFFGGRFTFFKETVGPLTIGLICVAFLAAVWLAISAFRRRNVNTAGIQEGAMRLARNLSFVWLSTYLLFLFFFIPQNDFYRLFYFPPVIILIGLFLARFEKRFFGLLPLLILIVAIANFLFYINPHSRVRGNTPLAMSLELNSVWTKPTVVLYATWSTDADVMQYFNPATKWIKVEEPLIESIEANVLADGVGETEVWLETSAIRALMRTPSGNAWLTERAPKNEWLELTDPAFDMKMARIYPHR